MDCFDSNTERVCASKPILRVLQETNPDEDYSKKTTYYIEYFFYKEVFNDSGVIAYERPFAWAVVDFKTGKVVQQYVCSEELGGAIKDSKVRDFSLIPIQSRYSLDNTRCSTRTYNSLCEMFDDVRASVIVNGQADMSKYNEYLTKVKGTVPKDFFVFYDELQKSNIT